MAQWIPGPGPHETEQTSRPLDPFTSVTRILGTSPDNEIFLSPLPVKVTSHGGPERNRVVHTLPQSLAVAGALRVDSPQRHGQVSVGSRRIRSG